jgi:hypothetical protein
MPVRSDRLAQLASPAFIAALSLLLLNDFALKPLLHNAITGKLSDFAGLFALTLFVATLWPRHARLLGVLIAAAFTFWKTTYAEPLIEALNAVSPLSFGRTVDLTDLFSLPVVPLALWAAPRSKPWPLPRALQLCLGLIAPIAFTATSQGVIRTRATAALTATAVIDESALQRFFDDLAREQGMTCSICEPIGEGRVYGEPFSRDLTVNFDADRRVVYFAASYSRTRAGKREIAELDADIRMGLAESFPGVAISKPTDERDDAVESTRLKVQVGDEHTLSPELAEGARRALSSIVEGVVRAHGLQADPRFYYAGRRRSWDVRDLELRANYEGNSALHVWVTYRNEAFEPEYRAVVDDLTRRVSTEFGTASLTSEVTQY